MEKAREAYLRHQNNTPNLKKLIYGQGKTTRIFSSLQVMSQHNLELATSNSPRWFLEHESRK
jgi:hypothetical protein